MRIMCDSRTSDVFVENAGPGVLDVYCMYGVLILKMRSLEVLWGSYGTASAIAFRDGV